MEWCAELGNTALPASGRVVAAYLVERCSELDENGRFTHGPGHLAGLISVIDDQHLAESWDAPSKSSEVRSVRDLLRRGLREIDGPRKASASQLLQRVLCEMRPTYQSDRDRAMILLNSLGPVSAEDLSSLTVDQITFAEGDGMLMSLDSSEEVWVGSIDVAWLCAPCAFIDWLEVVITHPVGSRGGRDRPDLYDPNWAHRCVGCWSGLDQIASGTPVFQKIDRRRAMTLEILGERGVAERVRRRFEAAGIREAAVSGAREELFVERLVHEVGLDI